MRASAGALAVHTALIPRACVSVCLSGIKLLFHHATNDQVLNALTYEEILDPTSMTNDDCDLVWPMRHQPIYNR